MASQAFVVDTGENKSVSLPQGEATELSFSTSEVAGMKLSDSGELTISFRDGGSLTINNFRELAEQDVQIALEGGDSINSKSLFDTLAADLAPVKLDLPQPGETVAYSVEAGRKYEVNINEPVQNVAEQDDALLITFNDGGQLVLRDFKEAVAADNTTEVSVDGEFMTLREFADGIQLAGVINGTMEEEIEIIQSEADVRTGEDQLAQLAQELSEIEPAAGEGANAGRGGFGFQSTVRSAPLNAPDAIGPIGPTALQFGLPEFQDELFFVDQPGSGPTGPNTPSLEFENETVYEDGSVLVDVFAQSNSTSATVTMTVTISGIPSSWGVDPNGGTYDAATGTWTANVTGATFAGGPILSPPADSDGDLPNLVATATNTDSSTGQSSSTTQTISVTTDAVADTPDVAANDSVANEDDPADLDITTAVTDTDGSEEITTVVISNVPAGFALSAGTETTPGTWVLTQAELTGLQITAPADYFGTITLDVTSTAEEVNKTDTDFDFTNDEASNSTQFDVTWKPVIDPPSIAVNGGVDEVQVKEDGTVDVTLEAALNPKDSPDAYITVTVTGFDPAWGTVTAPVGTFNGAGTEWTITMPAGTNLSTVFTFTPTAESDLDLTGLTATVVATEPATSTTASASDDFYIIVDAVADDPSITATGDTDVEGSTLDVDLAGSLGTDTDGSEQITGYQISGVPAEVTFSAGTNLGGGVWSFTPAEIAGLTASHADGDFDGSINLTATVFTTENPVSDGEFDTTDNNNQASDGFTLTWTPEIDPPTIKVNGGVPDVQVKEDGTVDVDLEVKLDDDAEPSEYLEVTITGFDPAWGTVTAPVGTFNGAGTEWTITMPAGQDLNTVFTFTPAAESDIDLTGLNITATATDPNEGISASANDSFDVIVDAVADDPTIDATGDTDVEGSTLDVDIQGMLGSDQDGSEQITGYQISGVPAEVTFSAGTNLGGGVWSFTPAEIVGLTASHADGDFDGSINLTATVFTTENPVSDGEFDTTDNNNQASDGFTLTWTPEIDPPTIKVNGGVPDVQVKEDGTVDVDLEVKLDDDAEPSEYLTVEVTGFDSAWGTVTAADGTFSPDGTTWTITMPAGQDLSTVFTFSPAAESDIDLTGLQITATSTDPVEGLSASANDSFNVIVDAVADDPTLDATGGTKEEGQPIDITLNGQLGSDQDGSEMITGYQISGVPSGFTFNQGTNLGGGVWSFTPTEATGLQIISTDSTFAGSLNLTATVFTTENPVSDGEFDTTDNNNQASDRLCVTWEDDDEPQVRNDEVSVDETDLAPTTAVSGTVTADFGDDTPGSFAANGGFFSGTPLTSNGQAVNVTLSGNTYTGATAGGETIFTLVVQSNGDYTFTLEGTLDHPDTIDHNDDFALEFGVTATDSDNDTGTGTITVNVFDDGLKANDDFNTVEEDIGTTDGNVITGLNGGPGAADDLSNDQPNKVTKVSFEGTEYDVPATGTVTVDGNFGQLEIAADGSYEYTLYTGSAGQKVYSFGKNNPPGGTGAGDIKNVEVSLNDTTNEFKFEMTMDGAPDGFTVALNGGPNPKGHAGELALIYFDGSDPSNPVITAYNYNGMNTQTSWKDGSGAAGTQAPDKIVSSLVDAGVFGNMEVSTDGSGNTVFKFSMDATVLQNHVPSYGNAADWTGLSFADMVGIWLHPVDGLNTSYGADGYLTDWSISSQSYYDTSNKTTDVEIIDDCDCGVDKFGYVLEDADGDTSTATLTLECLKDDTPIITKIEHKAVDETDMAPTTDVSGVVTADFFGDAPGSFSASGDSTQPSGLTSNGEAVTVTLSGDTYTGSAASGDVFTMEINADGSYTFTLLNTLDHPDKNDHNDKLSLQFGVTATDSDGDAVSGMINIDVFDDGLTAHDDCNVFNVVSVDKDYNVALMLDVSGSMRGDKLDLLKASVKNLLADYNAYQGGEIKVFISPFASGSQGGTTFTVTNDAEYQQAVNMINSMTANGFTNYEAPLAAAIDWLQSGEPISGAETYSYFISDGEPNRYVNDSNQVVSGSRDEVLDEIQGISDSTDEVDMLKSLSTEVIGVGIGVNSTTLAVLDIIDSDGNALDVQDPNDLDAALKGTNFFGSTSGNVITGENGGAGAADDLSNDVPNMVTEVSFGGVDYDVDPVNGVTVDGDFGTLEIFADGSYTYKLDASKLGGNTQSYALSPVESDTYGTQESLSKNGITVSVANSGDYDIRWVSTSDGEGLGIDNLNTSDSKKVWPKGEAFDLDFAADAQTVKLTIAELGDNNDDGYHGVDYILTLADGSTVTGEQQFVPSQIVDGYFTFELDAADYGQKISSVELFSTDSGSYKGASFLLNDVEITKDTATAPKDVFEYTLVDGDGDSSTAYLKLQGTFKPVIAGTAGDDLIVATAAEDILFGDTGADTFLFEHMDGGVDSILDFNTSEDDMLDLSTLISNYDPLQDSINDFVFATESNGSTTISVDANGSGNIANATEIVTLEGVTGLTVDDLNNNGNLVA